MKRRRVSPPCRGSRNSTGIGAYSSAESLAKHGVQYQTVKELLGRFNMLTGWGSFSRVLACLLKTGLAKTVSHLKPGRRRRGWPTSARQPNGDGV